MGYSGVRDGLEAILAAEELVCRAIDFAPVPWAATEQIVARFRLAVDRVMGRRGCTTKPPRPPRCVRPRATRWRPRTCCAHRSTLPRLAVCAPIDPDRITIMRRIVPAFREPDGPQLLGRTTDYTRRLVDKSVAAPAGPAPTDPPPEPARPHSAARGGSSSCCARLVWSSTTAPGMTRNPLTLPGFRCGHPRRGRRRWARWRGRRPAPWSDCGTGRSSAPMVTIGGGPGHRGRGHRGSRRRRGGPQPFRCLLRNVLRAQRTQGDRDGEPRHC